MTSFSRRSKDLDPSRIGSLSLGFEQDRDDAFLVNEIAAAISSRTTHIQEQSVITGLLAVNEDCRLTLPIFKKCLDTDNEELRLEMVRAIIRSVRDLLSVATIMEDRRGTLPRASDPSNPPMIRSAWYPFNALSVLACWHYETAPKDSPAINSEFHFDSPLWGIMQSLCDNANSADLSLPETLSWAAGRPDVETIRDLMKERALTSREEIESLLESQGNVATPVRNGIL